MGQEALESSSAVLQTADHPSGGTRVSATSPEWESGDEKRPDVARDTGPFGKAPESDLCHKRKVRTGAVFAGS